MSKNKINNKGFYYNIIDVNNHVQLVHDACKICWDQPAETDRQKQLEYIKKRIMIGHESILEHSNIIMYFTIQKETTAYDSFLEVMSLFKYLNISEVVDDDIIHLLIGGSIRAYKNIFRECKDLKNIIIRAIEETLYISSDKEYYTDLIDAGIMQERLFNNTFDWVPCNPMAPCREMIHIRNIDNYANVYNALKSVFSVDDILNVCSITILFKNMSRTATHQLVRHRNAITQESQRYVDYSNAGFTVPYGIDHDRIFNIKLGNESYGLTISELGDMLMKVYPQLREQGLFKEEARAFLPSNVQCKNLYMTFTFKSLIKFLDLRTDKSSQLEIREYANVIYEQFVEKTHSWNLGNIYKYLLPKYSLTENEYSYDNIDEVLEEIVYEEIIDQSQSQSQSQSDKE